MKRVPLLLVILGTLQMAADLTGLTAIKGIAAATNASPAPKVFSAVRGLETYSTRFFIEWTTPEGEVDRIELTPEVGSRIEGPYNRRNVYGAALAYAPVLPPELRDPVLDAALCGDRPLLAEIGIDVARVATPSIVLEPLPGTTIGDLPTRIPAGCR